MGCDSFNLPGGGQAIICSRGRRRQRCAFCGRPASHLCDGRKPRRKSGTCDRPLCPEHRTEISRRIERVELELFGQDCGSVTNEDTVDLCPDCVDAQGKSEAQLQLPLACARIVE